MQTALLTPMTTKQAPQRVERTSEGECAFSHICDFFVMYVSYAYPFLRMYFHW